MEILYKSDVDYLIFHSQDTVFLISILDKKSITKKMLDNAIQLKEKEFYILPVAVKYQRQKYLNNTVNIKNDLTHVDLS